MVRNEDLIKELLDQLLGLSTSFKVDPSHSFVQNERMRVQITIPELRKQDSESDIALSLFLHNSYDQSEGVRMYFGAIRSICSNGMVFGDAAWLYIVMNCKSDPELYRIQSPAKLLKFELKTKGVEYFLPMAEWKDKVNKNIFFAISI